MSHTNTTQLNLRKDGGNEAIVDFRGVVNDNMDLIDTAYGQYLDDYEQSLENIATIEGTTASAAHAIGTYLVQNGTLYRVTSSIAIGDTITPGTNITATDLNTAVTSLNTAASNLATSLAAVEQTTATANHAVGDYFMLGNVLMKATAAIATGEQISISNATPATLQSQINSLRESMSTVNARVPSNDLKIMTKNTDYNTDGFSIYRPDGVSYVIFYIDMKARVAILTRLSTSVITEVTMLNGTFSSTSLSGNSIQLNVGANVRGIFIISSNNINKVEINTCSSSN